MDLKSKTAFSGAAALVLAAVIILSATIFGFAPAGSRNLTPNSTGTLSVLLTDPATVPLGVSAVFVTYDNLRIHVSGFPSSTGWIDLNSSGTVETLGLAGQGEVITSAIIPSGTYDTISFNITSSHVEFQGKNYSATVFGSSLQASFMGALNVTPSGVNAALIDLQPTILNLGSAAQPVFLTNAAAKAAGVPSNQALAQSYTLGSRIPLSSSSWFANFLTNNTDRLTIGAASVSSRKLSITLDNPVGNPVVIKMVVVTPVLGAVPVSSNTASPSLIDSAIFLVLGNGSLQFIHYIGPSVQSLVNEVKSLSASPGYSLAPGASLSLAYNGTISLSFGGGQAFGSKTPGTFYVITVLGTQVLARTTAKGS